MTDPQSPGPLPHAAGDPVEVRCESRMPDWSAWLAECEQATIYHDARWGELMREVYRNRPHYLTARRAGRIVGTCVLIEQKSLLFGHQLSSIPYMDASGLLAADADARSALLAEAWRLLDACGAGRVELRQREPLDASLPAREDKVTMILSLPEDAETLWSDFSGKLRNMIRKAEKKNCEAYEGGPELLEEFYGQYARTMRDLGSPAHSLRFFRRLCELFESQVRLFAVRNEGSCYGASLTLRDRQALRVPWAGADWRYRDLNANMLLYWRMLRRGCEDGAGAFDFGRGTRGGGTHAFKKQWGAEQGRLIWHSLFAPGRNAEPAGGGDSHPLATKIWRRLPLPVANRLGPRIIRSVS